MKCTFDCRKNNLSNLEINKNIISGKYDTEEIRKTDEKIKKDQEVFWEQYKKDHPWIPLS